MATSDPIKYTDLVEEGAFERLNGSVEHLLTLLPQLEAAFKNALVPLKSTLKGGTKSLADVEGIQEAIRKTKEYNGALEVVTKAKAELTIETAKARDAQTSHNQDVKNALKLLESQVGSYNELEARLSSVTKRWKALSQAEREESEIGKALTKEKRELAERLKALDAQTGTYNRNVGNYNDKFKSYANTLRNLGGPIKLLGEMIGLHADTINDARVAIEHALQGISAFTDSAKANTLATEANTVSAQTNIVVTEEATAAKVAETEAVVASNAAWLATPMGIFAAIAVGIAAVSYAVYELTKAEHDSAEAIHIYNKALSDQRNEINKVRADILDASVDFDVLNKSLTELQGKKLKIFLGGMKDEFAAKDKHEQDLADLDKEYQRAIDENLKKQSANRALGLILDEADTQMFLEERNKKRIVMENQYHEQISVIKTRTATLTANELLEDRNKNLELIDKLNKDKIEKEKDYWRVLRDLRTENIRDDFSRKWKLILDDYQDETIKYEGQTAILKELMIKRNNELNNLREEQKRVVQKAMDEIAAMDEKEKIEAKEAEDKAAAEYVATQYKKIQMDEAAAEAKRKREERDAELARKAREKEIKQAFDHADTLLQIQKNFLDKKNEAIIGAIDHELDRNRSALEVQAQLAAAGLDNTLAYEMEKQNRLEKERVEELKRQETQAKRQEAVALGLAFLKAYTTELNSGKSPAQALSLAATETLAAKLLGKAIAGSAFDGVEDTGRAGDVDGKGGRLWVLHPHEGVVNRENNEKYAGAVGAMNGGKLEDWAMKNIYMPQLNAGAVVSDVSKSQQVDNALNRALLSEIKDLKEVVKNRPVLGSSLDGIHGVIRTEIRRGIKYTTFKKRSLD